MSRVENDVIGAFANPVRLRLLCCLSKGRSNVQGLISNCKLSQSAVSQHLLKLKNAGLVKCERDGKFVYYSLVHPRAALLARELNEFVRKFDQKSPV